MSRSDLEPFDRLEVITTELDEREVAHLLQTSSNLKLICQDCEGRRFVAEGFIPVSLDILSGEHILVSHIDYRKIVVNRVLKCAHCGCDDLVTITDPVEDVSNGNNRKS